MTLSKTALASLGLLCGLGLLVTACPAVLDDECAEGACGPRTNAGEGGSDVVDGGADAPLDPCIDMPTAAQCLDETKAIFVSSPNGDDQSATGMRVKPFKTIGAALKSITADKRRIYVCEGTYPEDLALNATHAGVSLFGGIDCTWKAAPAIKPVIGASANPVKIDGTTGLAIADLAVEAKDATTGSSIAVFANGSALTLNRVRITGGMGAKGDTGTRTDYVFPSPLSGTDGNAGGTEKLVMCPAGDTTKGGKGGASGVDGESGLPGADNKGTVLLCSMSNTGGGNGFLPGTSPAGAMGALTVGELNATGWKPEAGSDGANGGAGQGGGGGAGLGAGTGGGGGAGGCGGKGGGGGSGGGASVAIASYQTTIRLINAVLVAKDAGAGGAGGTGQAGQSPGGAHGSGTSATTACQGGNGAAGGAGAAGGGGAGGISVGILFKGSAPIADDGTKQAIIVGKKGSPGAGVGQMPGVDGVAQALLDLK